MDTRIDDSYTHPAVRREPEVKTGSCLETGVGGNHCVVRSGPVVTIRDLVSGNISRLLAGAQVPVERVAQAAATLGLDWTPAWLRSVEQGNRPLDSDAQVKENPADAAAITRRLNAAVTARITEAAESAGDNTSP